MDEDWLNGVDQTERVRSETNSDPTERVDHPADDGGVARVRSEGSGEGSGGEAPRGVDAADDGSEIVRSSSREASDGDSGTVLQPWFLEAC